MVLLPQTKGQGQIAKFKKCTLNIGFFYYSFTAFESEFPEGEYDDGNYGPNAYPEADYGRQEYHENYEPYR